MNKIIVLFIGLIFGIASQGSSQDAKGFIVNCKIKGLKDGVKVYLRTQEKDTVATAISQDEGCVFTGVLKKNGRFHFIVIDSLVTKAIFLINDKLFISGVIGKSDVKVKGSPAHLEYRLLVDTINALDKEQRIIGASFYEMVKKHRIANQEGDSSEIRSLKTSMEDIEKRRVQVNEQKTQVFKNWILTHTSSLYAPYLIGGQHKLLGLEETQKAYDRLMPEVKESYYGVELKKDLERLRLSSAIHEGGTIPNFSIRTLDNKSVFIHEIIKNYRYTLIDFWASWCSPCRTEVPSLKRLYTDFKDKGLNIIGISSDTNDASWKKAIKEDGTQWIHGIEGKEKFASKLFNLKAIPAYVVIDNRGNLIAFDCAMSGVKSFGGSLRGEALHKKIAELFITSISN